MTRSLSMKISVGNFSFASSNTSRMHSLSHRWASPGNSELKETLIRLGTRALSVSPILEGPSFLKAGYSGAVRECSVRTSCGLYLHHNSSQITCVPNVNRLADTYFSLYLCPYLQTHPTYQTSLSNTRVSSPSRTHAGTIP